MKYRKKPVVIEAIKYERWNQMALANFVDGDVLEYDSQEEMWCIKTLEGKLYVSEGDYVIKGVQGEFYPCKPDIFEATYDEVKE